MAISREKLPLLRNNRNKIIKPSDDYRIFLMHLRMDMESDDGNFRESDTAINYASYGIFPDFLEEAEKDLSWHEQFFTHKYGDITSQASEDEQDEAYEKLLNEKYPNNKDYRQQRELLDQKYREHLDSRYPAFRKNTLLLHPETPAPLRDADKEMQTSHLDNADIKPAFVEPSSKSSIFERISSAIMAAVDAVFSTVKGWLNYFSNAAPKAEYEKPSSRETHVETVQNEAQKPVENHIDSARLLDKLSQEVDHIGEDRQSYIEMFPRKSVVHSEKITNNERLDENENSNKEQPSSGAVLH